MELRNETPFAAGLFGLVLADGAEAVGVAVKGTWALPAAGDDAPLSLSDAQQPLRLTPEYAGAPGASGLRYPADVGLPKPGTDCILVADAVAPNGAADAVFVRFEVGPVGTTALVFGERAWTRSLGTTRPGDPARFERLPLVWEHAYGGSDVAPDGTGQHHAANPVGQGFRRHADAHPPRIERPDALVTSPADRPPPAATLPVAPDWSPRRERAGTYGDAWRSLRAPYLPDDYDARFACVAPDDLVATPPLVGGERVRIEGVRADGAFAFALPAPPVRAAVQTPARRLPLPLVLSLVLVDVEAGLLCLTWAGAWRIAEDPALGIRVWTP